MKVIVVGGGKLVYFLCRNLIARDHTVVVVNRNETESRWLARRMKALVIHGDGTDPSVLEEAGGHDADTIVAVTPSDPDNLIICQVAKLRFGVPHTVAVLADPDNEKIFPKLGVTTVVSMPRIVSALIEERTAFEDIINLLPAAEGRVNITELALSERSPIQGQRLAEIPLPRDSLIACVIRQDEAVIPRGDTLLAAGDRVLLVSLPASHAEAVRILTGDVD
ncbi:MAG: TrkA family potassium uptake protein [Planctomycetales bacterium]